MAEKETGDHCGEQSENICVECGMCCDGSMFKRAVVAPNDDSAFLKQMGVESFIFNDKVFFSLPCKAQENIKCGLYFDKRRYAVCRTFRCKLLKQYDSGEVSYSHAIAVIREARLRKKRIQSFRDELNGGENNSAQTVFDFLRELYRSRKAEEPAFRRQYAQQLLDCLIFRELLKTRFYKRRKPSSKTGVMSFELGKK